ncbi:MAG TPA: hypothetical protein VFQ76_20230 [Longimicrobiaceae bacterium]|nr:hypothetical protein [Longimicrobiaceae bacterium]
MRPLPGLLALFCLASGVSAQERMPLDTGARVRVTVTGPAPLVRTGTLLALSDTTLHLRSGSLPVAIPLATVVRLDRSRGRALGRTGGVVGFLLGGAAGGIAGCLANRDAYGVFCGGQSDATVFAGAALGGAAGAALGAVLPGRERWSRLDLPPQADAPRTPPPGSTERRTILDALRAEMRRLDRWPVVFVVRQLRVQRGWAWLEVDPQSPDGSSRYEPEAALLRRRSARWQVVERMPAFAEREGGALEEDCAYFAHLRGRFPGLPAGILPPAGRAGCRAGPRD